MVYITGDIHGDFNRLLKLKKFCKAHNLGKNDWIVRLGDVGLNYYGKDDPREWSIKTIAADIPANLFVSMEIMNAAHLVRMIIRQRKSVEIFAVRCGMTHIIQISISLLMAKFTRFLLIGKC